MSCNKGQTGVRCVHINSGAMTRIGSPHEKVATLRTEITEKEGEWNFQNPQSNNLQ